MKKNILLLFFSWKLLITSGLVLGAMVLPLQTGYLGGGVQDYLQNSFLWAWVNFDGIHYLSIAQNGYTQNQQAFFPLFPLLIKIVTTITTISAVYVGLTISHMSLFFALLILLKLLKMDYSAKQSLWVIIFLVFFPTAYYFGSIYTESLFLLLSISAFYCARKKKWFLAGLCGMLASLTRFTGVFLFPVLLVEYIVGSCHCEDPPIRRGTWQSIIVVIFDKRLPRPELNGARDDKEWLWLLLIPLGLLLYMFWLNQNYGDPLLFIHAQTAFGANRSGNSIVLLPQVFYRYLKIITLSNFTYQYLVAVFELTVTVLFLILSIISFKKLRFSYAFFAFCSLLLPTLTGSFSSMPRYVLTIFPLFITLNLVLKINYIKYLVLAVFVAILVLSTMLFTRGYWVS